MNVLLALVAARLQWVNLDSGIPPSTDPDRPGKVKPEGRRNPGGQSGPVGTILQPVEEPDEIKVLSVDRSTLPEVIIDRPDSKNAESSMDGRLDTASMESELLTGFLRFGLRPALPTFRFAPGESVRRSACRNDDVGKFSLRNLTK